MNGGEEFPQAPLLSGVAAGRPVSGEELRHSPPSGEEWRPKIGSTNSLKPLRPIFSSSAEEGKADAVAAAGVVLVKKIHLLANTTPSARSKVASQLFLCRAATPPRLRRGAHAAREVSPSAARCCWRYRTMAMAMTSHTRTNAALTM